MGVQDDERRRVNIICQSNRMTDIDHGPVKMPNPFSQGGTEGPDSKKGTSKNSLPTAINTSLMSVNIMVKSRAMAISVSR